VGRGAGGRILIDLEVMPMGSNKHFKEIQARQTAIFGG
jgi:hypothetical protein